MTAPMSTTPAVPVDKPAAQHTPSTVYDQKRGKALRLNSYDGLLAQRDALKEELRMAYLGHRQAHESISMVQDENGRLKAVNAMLVEALTTTAKHLQIVLNDSHDPVVATARAALKAAAEGGK